MAQHQNFQKNRRLRVFAGPNGSGKSTILQEIISNYDIGHYINADDLEKQLREEGFVSLKNYNVESLKEKDFQKLIKSHSIFRKARKEGHFIDLHLKENKVLKPDESILSYEAALLADILRNEILKLGKKFAFETVMSHNSKIEFLKETKQNGYKNYLYYVSTESPLININRVEERVRKGGHSVDPAKIESRYFDSLKLLRKAVKHTYRSFIIDNSGRKPQLIAEIYDGKEVIYKRSTIPNWVDKYLLRTS